jgi:hypothetical protein
VNIDVLKCAAERFSGSRTFRRVAFTYPHSRCFAVTAHAENHGKHVSLSIPCGPNYWETCHVTGLTLIGGKSSLKREIRKMIASIKVTK